MRLRGWDLQVEKESRRWRKRPRRRTAEHAGKGGRMRRKVEYLSRNTQ
jgi:hypothetical protein